jgi:hypothetical protein
VYLTAYFDGDNPVYATKNAGIYELDPPSVNILGGSTKAWLRTGLSEEKGTSGYSARFLYVVLESTERISTGDYEVPEAREKMIEILRYADSLAGEISVTPEVWTWYETWYTEHATKLQEAPDNFMLGFLGRLPAHLWKLAMIFSALRLGEKIEMQDVLDAKQYLEWLEPTIGQVYNPKKGNPSGGLLNSILELFDREQSIHEDEVALTLFQEGTQADVKETLYLLARRHILARRGLVFSRGPEFNLKRVHPPSEKEVMSYFGLEESE